MTASVFAAVFIALYVAHSVGDSLGTPSHPDHPVTAEGAYAPTLDTGSYALDQSFHHLFLGVAALLIAVL